MNRERAKELLPVIEAYANGATVEIYAEAVGDWEEIADPSWVTNSAYRIKPEPHDIKWAAEQITKGYGVRRRSWPRPGLCWAKGGNNSLCFLEYGMQASFMQSDVFDLLADDWELYEPKGK